MVFDVWRARTSAVVSSFNMTEPDARSTIARRWLEPDEAAAMPISNAQRRVLALGLANLLKTGIARKQSRRTPDGKTLKK
jgi:hypothetical protein